MEKSSKEWKAALSVQKSRDRAHPDVQIGRQGWFPAETGVGNCGGLENSAADEGVGVREGLRRMENWGWEDEKSGAADEGIGVWRGADTYGERVNVRVGAEGEETICTDLFVRRGLLMDRWCGKVLK